jgi:hypothetical protein
MMASTKRIRQPTAVQALKIHMPVLNPEIMSFGGRSDARLYSLFHCQEKGKQVMTKPKNDKTMNA